CARDSYGSGLDDW
nr:immunoglobulin heavy chain junction region [Macaca mulatta]MOV40679.1 immunoglobulin heavy chain junction region [Macaca mulatta]MOV41683.1 immunoglobulin heavy chain junction region [Macaca mulatta]MOV42047.1 immunoglobulin heavy chain junction region [Macaca mulatta]MOV42165.1 immunoglobulin heavy chain junction region [Macaca mulatta]